MILAIAVGIPALIGLTYAFGFSMGHDIGHAEGRLKGHQEGRLSERVDAMERETTWAIHLRNVREAGEVRTH